MTARKSSRSGFTLIELLIVVVVIGILATIGIVRFDKVRQRSHVAAAQTDLRNLIVQQEQYHMQFMTYTATVSDLGFEPTQGVNITVNPATPTGWAAIATHSADASIQCGVYTGDAPAASGAPATLPEVVECTF